MHPKYTVYSIYIYIYIFLRPSHKTTVLTSHPVSYIVFYLVYHPIFPSGPLNLLQLASVRRGLADFAVYGTDNTIAKLYVT